MSGGGGRKPVKIVLINTQYVETDETSFKSVVQELTGKHSRVRLNNKTKSRKVQNSGMMKMEEAATASASASNIIINDGSVLMRDLSFQEFDRLLKEMPPVDGLYDSLWTN